MKNGKYQPSCTGCTINRMALKLPIIIIKKLYLIQFQYLMNKQTSPSSSLINEYFSSLNVSKIL